MSFGRKKSSSVEPAKVEFSPRSFELSPFGKYEYADGGFKTTPSEAEGKGISLRQQLINELLPEIGKPSDARADQINQFGDLFTQDIFNRAAPLFNANMYGRGLSGSTAYSRGFGELLNDAIKQGLFAREDLFTQDLNNQLNAGQFLEGGLQNAFNRLLAISQQGKSQNDQYFGVQESNANRAQAANQFNAKLNYDNNSNKLGAFGDLAGLAGLQMFGGGGGLGGLTSSAAGTTLNKTGGKTSFSSYAKDPDTWIKLANLAAMAAGACHVASEIFGGWYHPDTVSARVYMNVIAPEKLRNLYSKWSKRIALFVRNNPEIKESLRPIFEEFSARGRRYMEAAYALN